jgi:hypothetical protein
VHSLIHLGHHSPEVIQADVPTIIPTANSPRILIRQVTDFPKEFVLDELSGSDQSY